jgi:hypothetical protein
MSRLYPPIIEGTIPAFGGATLVVPFSLNRAVASADISTVKLKIKTVNGILKETVTASEIMLTGDCFAKFILDPNKYTIGQFYKVQIAFVKGDAKKGQREEVGYYSTVGVVKHTTEPTVSIEGLTFGKINPHNYYYTGVYSQARYDDKGKLLGYGDTTEKLYSYRFVISDSTGAIIDDTGEILHNSTKDILSYETSEEYCFAKDIKANESYFISFIVTTVNGMVASSKKYRITQNRSIRPEIDIELVATLDEGSGFIDLTIGECSSELITGTFLLSRCSSRDEESWVEFKRFNLHAIQANTFSIKDCTVEHGEKYKYSIQQYNANKIYSERIISNTVLVDFEDAFLFDGERQLRIRYNPQVNSFKTTHADQKTDTIGSQHPFIVRNGNMAYKEFPIGGLISYRMDEDNHMFMSPKKLGIDVSSNDLTSENIIAERVFKLSVLDWLNDGKPKLFRSPSEGNYIVRLMNVSMSPQTALGRMLHSFTATAYEVAPFNADSLAAFKIIDATESLEEQMQWSSVYLPDLFREYNTDKDGNVIKPASPIPVQLNNSQRRAYSVKFTDMPPGSFVYIGDNENSEQIMIGATGAFMAESEKGFAYIGTDSRFLQQGMCTYGYKAKTITMFNSVNALELRDVPCRQFIGNTELANRESIFKSLEDERTEVTSVSMVRFFRRPVNYFYIDYTGADDKKELEAFLRSPDLVLYSDMDCKLPVEVLTDCDELATYQLRLKRTNKKYVHIMGEQYYVDRNNSMFSPYLDFYIDGKVLVRGGRINIYPITTDMYDVKIDGNAINLTEIERYDLSDPEAFTDIAPGNGLITEIGYSSQVIEYSFEDAKQNPELNALMLGYQDSVTNYWKIVQNPDATFETVRGAKVTMENHYLNYLNALKVAIKEYKEAFGVV